MERLIEAQSLADEIKWAAFVLGVGAAEIFAEDSEAQELRSAEQQDDQQNPGPGSDPASAGEADAEGDEA